jgi:beta-glucanase (GH16 family)
MIESASNDNHNVVTMHYKEDGWQREWMRNYTYNYSQSEVNQWHTYAMEWSPNCVLYYIDGKQILNINSPYCGQLSKMQMIIDINAPLEMDDGVWNFSMQGAKFPFDYDIDYVFVKKLKCDIGTSFTANSYTQLQTYDNKVKKDVTIGGGTSSVVIPNNADVYVRAKDYILLDAGFEVQPGGSFYANVSGCE